MKVLNTIALALVIIGGLNWGLIGLFDFNLVTALFGIDTFLTNAVYIIVGVAALYAIYLFKPVIQTPMGHNSADQNTAHHHPTR